VTVTDLPVAWVPAVTPEVPRDHFGRPLILPPGGGKPVAYTRATTFVGCLEDTNNLTRWAKRMVALGLASRDDLALRVASLGPQPDDEEQARSWKKDMDRVCEAATEAAKASAAATIGTALHALTERHDRGLTPGSIPAAYAGHLDAYAVATQRFSMRHIEAFCVQDQLKIGGTPDRVMEVDGRLVIGDVKTGDVTYGAGKIAMQLAVYAHSELYDVTTGTRTPLGDVDTDRGLIIALDAKTGLCRLLWVDIAAGWESVQLAGQVRQWRNRRSWTEDYAPPVAPRVNQAAVAALASAIRVAPTPQALVELWTTARTAWTDEHTTMATARKAELLAGVAS
jgi:hypothetical protein